VPGEGVQADSCQVLDINAGLTPRAGSAAIGTIRARPRGDCSHRVAHVAVLSGPSERGGQASQGTDKKMRQISCLCAPPSVSW
jgi:hypothetical protein